MDISEIENKMIKINSHSITVKNEQGKTCGIVNNIKPFKELRPSDGMKYFKLLRECGLWGNSDLIKYFIVYDGEPYYLHNLKPLETYERLFSGKDGFENEEKRYNERKQIADKVAAFATVIPCYVI